MNPVSPQGSAISPPQYMLCVRGAKSKWYTLAGVNLGPKSCLRAAEIVFQEAGFDTFKANVKWGDLMSEQQNWGGYATDYRVVIPGPVTLRVQHQTVRAEGTATTSAHLNLETGEVVGIEASEQAAAQPQDGYEQLCGISGGVPFTARLLVDQQTTRRFLANPEDLVLFR